MGESKDFERCININRIIMSYLGVWPGVDGPIHWFSHLKFFAVTLSILFFDIIPQTHMLFFVLDDFDTVMDILMTADIILSLACIKLITLWYHRAEIKYLVSEIAVDWKTIGADKKLIINGYTKLSQILIKISIVMTHGSVISYGFLSVFISITDSMKDQEQMNETISRNSFLISKFFFNSNISPIYEICWISQFATALIGASCYSCFDAFFTLSILHACGQMKILQQSIGQIIDQKYPSDRTFGTMLGYFVEKHNRLHRFTDCIERSFNKAMLLQMICFSMSFCLQGYQSIMIFVTGQINIFKLIFIADFTLGNVIFIFIYCFIVEKLEIESVRLLSCLYEAKWYELKPKDSRMLINVMHKTNFPPRITAGKFFTFSLRYFMTVMKTSLGYVSVLFTMKSTLQE